MNQATPIVLIRENNKNAALRPSQSVMAQGNGYSIYIAKENPYYYRQIQKAGRTLDQMGLLEISLEGDWTFDEQWALQLGYSRFKNPGKINYANMSSAENSKFAALTQVWNWTRTVINAGPSQLPPLTLATKAEELIREFAKERYTLKIEKIIGEELKEKGFIGCYSVGRGSEFPPVLLSIKIYPKGMEDKKIIGTLIGKGITFDSGGYIIKSRDGGISYMKADMGGAATVTAAMALSLFEGVDQPVELILACAENMVSDKAYRPGDVITYKNGLSIEIVNTDAEGRVVLADGILKAQEENPRFILDAATLTGAAKIAVGGDFCALFSMDTKLRNRALSDAETCHEGLWPLPLELWHQDAFPSLVADAMNADVVASASPANASAAAAFLSRFIKLDEQKWLHYDLANIYFVNPNAMWPGGATGLMIQSIAKTFRQELKP